MRIKTVASTKIKNGALSNLFCKKGNYDVQILRDDSKTRTFFLLMKNIFMYFSFTICLLRIEFTRNMFLVHVA
jgi:hypothetical protein